MKPKLNDPELVGREYEDESRFNVRQAAWRSATGPDAHDVVPDALREISPSRVPIVQGLSLNKTSTRVARRAGVL